MDLAALTFEQLQALRTIIRTGTFSRAAEEMFLSQPAISQRISHLEKALVAKLFCKDPNRRTIRLTTAGEHVLHFADEVSTLLGQLEADLKKSNEPTSRETINLVCGLIAAQYVVPDMLDAYRRLQPQVHVNLIEVTSDKIGALVRSGEVDLGILDESHSRGFRRVTLFIDRAVLVAALGHPVLSQPEEFLRSQTGCPFVAGPPGSLGRIIAERWAAYLHIRLNIVVETTGLNAMKETVIRGLGLTILPEVAIRGEVRDGRLEIVSVRGLPRNWRICLIFDERRGLGRAARAFQDIALNGVTPRSSCPPSNLLPSKGARETPRINAGL